MLNGDTFRHSPPSSDRVLSSVPFYESMWGGGGGNNFAIIWDDGLVLRPDHFVSSNNRIADSIRDGYDVDYFRTKRITCLPGGEGHFLRRAGASLEGSFI